MSRQFLLAVLILVLAPVALGWGPDGHRVVCQIAFQRLDRDQQRELNRIARSYRLHGQRFDNFAQSCLFADNVRRTDPFTEFDQTHFINLPRDARTLRREFCENTCVLDGIDIHSGELANADDDVDRAEALFFLSHWIGDLHQPLHVSFEDDRGGGQVPVRSNFYPQRNLHSLWDGGIVARAMGNRGWRNYADDLNDEITDDDVTAWTASEPLQWTQESYDITIDDDTDYCEVRDGECAAENHTRRPTRTYQERFQDDVERRLKQGGVRLAETLRRTLFARQ